MAEPIRQDENPFFGLEELYGRTLKTTEKREIACNLSEFFAILHEWRDEDARNNEQGDSTDAQEKSPGEQADRTE